MCHRLPVLRPEDWLLYKIQACIRRSLIWTLSFNIIGLDGSFWNTRYEGCHVLFLVWRRDQNMLKLSTWRSVNFVKSPLMIGVPFPLKIFKSNVNTMGEKRFMKNNWFLTTKFYPGQRKSSYKQVRYCLNIFRCRMIKLGKYIVLLFLKFCRIRVNVSMKWE